MGAKRNIPQKGASKKWSERLKNLGKQDPPQDLLEKIKRRNQDERAATSRVDDRDVEI
jgi:hypothetical protein